MKKTLQIKGLKKQFKSNVIFDDLNLYCEGGKLTSIVGPNGCGKTVLLKMIAGIMTPDKGQILYNNQPLNRSNAYVIKIGISIEKPQFIEELSAYDNLMFLASFRNIVDEAVINDYLKKFDLYKTKNKKVKEFSLGMKQKLSIIQALMEEPNIILFDEVSNSLDNSSRELLFSILQEEKEKGKIILYVNHNFEEVVKLSDSILIIDDRRLEPWENTNSQ
ncbi:MAG: ABC transporter ATP-binding protein [Bacilli bacterium]